MGTIFALGVGENFGRVPENVGGNNFFFGDYI
jgi:hypothetical protein